MAREEIEQRAGQLLSQLPKWLWDGKTLPVPVEALVDDRFGLLVKDVADMSAAPGAPTLDNGQTLSGLLLADRKEIWVNADEARQWPPRRRFTIGHELGHWVMHRRPGQGSLFCRHGSIDPEQSSEPADETLTLEDEANIFAAALTMPTELIRSHYDRLRHNDDCHAQMCDLFAASGAAMGRRLRAVI